MKKYSFRIRKHIRDDMYKNEIVEIELIDSEIIRSDDEKYSKYSALLSSKLGERVQVMEFPTEIKSAKSKEINEEKSSPSKKSIFKPLWAFPFKLIWRIVKLLFK